MENLLELLDCDNFSFPDVEVEKALNFIKGGTGFLSPLWKNIKTSFFFFY